MTSRADSSYYRPDIDGLRAFAVAAVFLYHIDEKILPGGFLGVDVFFVISGFVVTASTLRTASAKPLDDVLRFWRRRLLRIIPALLAFVLGTVLLSALFLPPYPMVVYTGVLRTGIAALLGVGNLYLYRLGQDYFASDQTLNLFLHTWSLGVEEQFYVVFSILLIVIPGLMLGRSAASHRAKLICLAALSAGSFVLFLRGSTTDWTGTYYFLHTRLWELGAGGMLAFVAAGARLGRLRSFGAGLMQAAAALALAWVVVAPRDSWIFPTSEMIVAVIATGVLIVTGDSTRRPLSRLLSAGPVVFVGLMSYSLYLWHWPVLTILRFTTGLHTLSSLSAAVALTAGLGFLSYRFVELPWRWSSERFLSQLAPKALAAAAIAIALAGAASKFPGFIRLGTPQKWAEEWLPGELFSYGGAGKISQKICLLHTGDNVPLTIPTECVTQPADASGETVFVVGDSFSFANWGMVTAAARSEGFGVAALAHNNCSAITKVEARSESCRKYWELVLETVRQRMRRGDVVFVSFWWTATRTAGLDGVTLQLAELVNAARETGARLVVQAPLPEFERPGFSCIPDWYRVDMSGCTVQRQAVDAQRKAALSLLGQESLSRALTVWDPVDSICRENCTTFEGSKPLFRDKLHLSFYGATSLGDEFARVLAGG